MEHHLLLTAPAHAPRWWQRALKRWFWQCSCGMHRSTFHEAVARREMAAHQDAVT